MTDEREHEIVGDPEKLREQDAQRGAGHDDPHKVIDPKRILEERESDEQDDDRLPDRS